MNRSADRTFHLPRNTALALAVVGMFAAGHGAHADETREMPAFSNATLVPSDTSPKDENDGDIEDSLLAFTWSRGQWNLSAMYSELEWLPSPAPGLRETTTTLRAGAAYRVTPTVQLAISGFHTRNEDEAGQSGRGSGALLALRFKIKM